MAGGAHRNRDTAPAAPSRAPSHGASRLPSPLPPPLPSSAAYAAPLLDGFEGDGFSPAGGLYYRRNAEQEAGTYAFQREVTRGSAGALKLSVRSLADGGGGSERAEVWEQTALRVPYDRAVWYGFSVRFGEPVPQDDHRHLIAQWKREIGPSARGDYSPFLALRLVRGRLFATVETKLEPEHAAGASGRTPAWLRHESGQMRALVATDAGWEARDGARFRSRTDRIAVIDRGGRLPLPGSGWIDFAVMTRPGPGGDGRIELFANDRWIVTVRGAIGHDDPGLGPNQYFKFGPYRSAARQDWTLYYDNFRRSMRAEHVLGPDLLAEYRAAGAGNRP